MTQSKTTKYFWIGAAIGAGYVLLMILLQAINIIPTDNVPALLAIPLIPANFLSIPFLILFAAIFPGAFVQGTAGTAAFIIITLLILLMSALFYGFVAMLIGWASDRSRSRTRTVVRDRPSTTIYRNVDERV